MAHASWGSGWPNCQTSKLLKFTAGGRSWTTRREVVPIFKSFIDEIVTRGYKISDGQLDDWSWNCRAIAGTTVPSNHSFGLAIDVNSLTNPMTFNGKLVTNVPGWVVESAKAHGLVWGGNYSGSKKDPMHFEWTHSLTDAEVMVRHLVAIAGAINQPAPVAPPTGSSFTMSEASAILAAIGELKADVFRLGERVIAIEKSVHGVGEQNDPSRDASILLAATYLRGELLGGENARRLREILKDYGDKPKA